jgi:glutaredoxin
VIYVVISDDCPHCEKQLEYMRKSFFEDEYRIVKYASDDFESLSFKEKVTGVPFVAIFDRTNLCYAEAGVLDGTALRRIERFGGKAEAFNLHKARSA